MHCGYLATLLLMAAVPFIQDHRILVIFPKCEIIEDVMMTSRIARIFQSQMEIFVPNFLHCFIVSFTTIF